MKLIINADDLGISRGANLAIKKAHENGCLTHASIMVTSQHFEEALKDVVQKCPHLGVGLHINLTYGRPVSGVEKVFSLVDSEGKFCKNFFGLLRKRKNKNFRRQVELEIEAQLMKAVNSGIKLSHLDSHEHIHFIPYISEIVMTLASKYGIKRVRQLNESYVGTFMITRSLSSIFHINTLKLGILKLVNGKRNTVNSKYFFSILEGGKIKSEHIERLKKVGKYELVEIMLHPGYPNVDVETNIEMKRIRKWLLSPNRKKELNSCLEERKKSYSKVNQLLSYL